MGPLIQECPGFKARPFLFFRRTSMPVIAFHPERKGSFFPDDLRIGTRGTRTTPGHVAVHGQSRVERGGSEALPREGALKPQAVHERSEAERGGSEA